MEKYRRPASPHYPIFEELGRMPSARELADRQRTDLAGAVGKFGGIRKVANVLGYRYAGYQAWTRVEDLQPHLDPIVDELGRMPGIFELKARARFDLLGAINKFGGVSKVAELLNYSYSFAPALERRQRVHELETALSELHQSQMLSDGQVMLVLRHAGLLSANRVIDTKQRLSVVDYDSRPLDFELTTLATTSECDQPSKLTIQLTYRAKPSKPLTTQGQLTLVKRWTQKHGEAKTH